jgi:FHS family L-fucose permease-like MFS transporter
VVFFFESICWPTIYALAISRLGKHTKLGGSLVVSGVGGGALYAPLQGVLADARNTQLSYMVSFVGFLLASFYGVGMSFDAHRRKNINAKTGLMAVGRSSDDGSTIKDETHHAEDEEKAAETPKETIAPVP